MAEPATITTLPISAKKESDKKDKPLDTFQTRVSDELVIAFSGPVGCGISNVIEQTKIGLESRGYTVYIIKLSTFIEDALKQNDITLEVSKDLTITGKAKRYIDLQDGGNELRKKFGYDILAEYAVKNIVGFRLEQVPTDLKDAPKNSVPKKNAFLIDQIKHPQEVQLFRAVYRKLFHLVGVVSVESKRQKRLEHVEQIPVALAARIMERDRKQEEENGQQLDKALKMADFFIRSDRGTIDSIKKQMDRFVSLLHGQNGITPTKQEYGMYVAYAAGLRSACLSRQVGAAIEDTTGEIISTGCNDVPKSGGGLYSFEDGTDDKRCVHKEEQVCFNDREKKLLKTLMRTSLEEAKDKTTNEQLIKQENIDQLIDTVYKASRIYDLIEFSRAVHAEMDAIITLVRTGTPGIVGSILYCTTFPCHSCARHIVAAGIKKTYYIEPYEKSLAKNLHSDAIEFETEDDDATHKANIDDSKILSKFVHFEGVAPSQYLNFFTMPKRKDGDGKVIVIAPEQAKKSVSEYLDDYRDFESKVVEHLKDILQNTTDN